MRTAKMFWRDMCLGTFRHGARFLIIPLVVVLMTAGFAEYAANLYDAGTIAGSGTAADYYLCVMQGMYIYKFSPDSTFVIPISWFMLHIGLAYLTAYYPCKDYNEYGAIVIPAGGSRIRWWIAKMFWCLMTVFLYYIGIAITCAISACVHGAKLSADFSVDLLEHLYGDSMNYVSQSDMILISVLLPFAISVLMTEVQMLFSFLFTPVISFAATCGVYILSAYYTCWWLPGSYTMWQRSSYINYEGVKPMSGFVIAVFGLLCVIVCGTLYFQDKDVLD